MADPTDVITGYRPDLASLFEFNNAANEAGFIANEVLPTFPVDVVSGTYYVLPREAVLENRDTRRASGSGYARSDYKFESATFATEEHGAEEPIDDRKTAIYKNIFDLEKISVMRAVGVVLRNKEIRAAQMLQNTSTWTPVNATTAWATLASADPAADVAAGKKSMRDTIGQTPNTLVVTEDVFDNLIRTDAILDGKRYVADTSPSKVNIEAVASALNIEKLLVAKSMYNTAKKGQAASLGSIWDSQYACLCYVDYSLDLEQPTVGRSFEYTGDGSSEYCTVEVYREEKIRGFVVRARQEVTENLVSTDCNYLIDVTAAS